MSAPVSATSRTRVPVIRSGVRPKSAKLPWGTIIQTEFGLGFQRLTAYEIQQSVSRLYYVPMQAESSNSRYRTFDRKLKKIELDAMINRLSKNDPRGTPDNNRTLKASQYKDLGVIRSYAWTGYN